MSSSDDSEDDRDMTDLIAITESVATKVLQPRETSEKSGDSLNLNGVQKETDLCFSDATKKVLANDLVQYLDKTISYISGSSETTFKSCAEEQVIILVYLNLCLYQTDLKISLGKLTSFQI